MRHHGHRFRYEGSHLFRHGVDGVDAIVQEEGLPAAIVLALKRFGQELIRPLEHVRVDGHPVPWRRADERHVPDPRNREVERPGNGRRREREHVDRRAHPLEALLVLDAEPLFLIDDQQAQILHHHVLGEQAVGSDDDVDLAGLDLLEDLFLLLCRPKAAQSADSHRVVGEALLECVAVLFDQDRRGCQDRDLLAVLNRLEGCPDRDLRLAVPDVSADEAVHGPRRFHVALHVYAGLPLVRGVLIEEGRLHLHLPTRVGREREPGRGLSTRVELEQFGGHLLDDLLGLPLDVLPPLAADAVNARRLGVVGAADPALDQVEPVDRKPE